MKCQHNLTIKTVASGLWTIAENLPTVSTIVKSIIEVAKAIGGVV